MAGMATAVWYGLLLLYSPVRTVNDTAGKSSQICCSVAGSRATHSHTPQPTRSPKQYNPVQHHTTVADDGIRDQAQSEGGLSSCKTMQRHCGTKQQPYHMLINRIG
eukprot:GHUV01048170.1.p1 GENE.GHUV01048170.1~~GHUV01048170.1.p1  ORF type:complete len:106 (-),score=3.78 GHUV01048170.1:47-364(-)